MHPIPAFFSGTMRMREISGWNLSVTVISTDYRGQAAFRFPLLYDPNGYYNYFVATSSDITSFVLHVKSTSNTTASNVLRASLYIADWPENNYGHVQKLLPSARDLERREVERGSTE